MLKYRLKELMGRENISVEQMSKLTGITPTTIAAWRNLTIDSSRSIPGDTILKVSKILNVTVEELHCQTSVA